jgi:hypothetical protein
MTARKNGSLDGKTHSEVLYVNVPLLVEHGVSCMGFINTFAIYGVRSLAPIEFPSRVHIRNLLVINFFFYIYDFS